MDVAVFTALPGAVQAKLARHGVTLEELARTIVAGEGEPVLLTGSYATGEANPTSDLDFLVLTPERVHRRLPDPNHPSILGDSFDRAIRGLLLNVEYVAEPRLLEVCEIARSVRQNAGTPDLPNLQALEIRLVQRVDHGLALCGKARVDQLRQQLDVDAVRASTAALNFVMAMSLLEDTQVMASPAREVMCRGAGESLLLAALNAYGPITYDAKHVCSRAANLTRQPEAPRVIRQWSAVLFADRRPYPEGAAMLLELADDLLASFRSCGLPVLRLLEPFRDQWSWSPRHFNTAPSRAAEGAGSRRRS